MSRAQRLLDLIQLLRGYRRPVSGAVLAEALGISLRTLYRDIDTLNAQGAHIDGEPGVGYVLRPGFMLPPLMFSEEEIEAIVLGSRWVADRADAALSAAARNALAKIAASAAAGSENQPRYVEPSDRAGESDLGRRQRIAGHAPGDPR
jgi:predicted DNA-binding transcriptional regulator YafY